MKKIALLLVVAILFSVSSCTMLPSDLTGNTSEYTITFNSNGGSEVSPMNVGKLKEAPKTTKEDSVFCGWYTDEELKNAVSYPFTVKEDVTLYAKWTQTTEVFDFGNATVQFSTDNSYKTEYEVTPKELDLKALAAQGYNVQIDVTYEVYYEKNYNVPFDFGYLGAPDHDVYLVNAYDDGLVKENLPTSTEATAETLSIVISAAFLSKNYYYLRLVTYNTQNIVYFNNIRVTYTCVLP